MQPERLADSSREQVHRILMQPERLIDSSRGQGRRRRTPPTVTPTPVPFDPVGVVRSVAHAAENRRPFQGRTGLGSTRSGGGATLAAGYCIIGFQPAADLPPATSEQALGLSTPTAVSVTDPVPCARALMAGSGMFRLVLFLLPKPESLEG